MGFTKYQKVESKDVNVVSRSGHKAIESSLHRLGKTSATQLTEEELDSIKKLDSSKSL